MKDSQLTDPEKLWYPQARTTSYFFHRQAYHLLSLLILVPLAWRLAYPYLGDDVWLGVSSMRWFWLSLMVAVIHQVVAWIVFRLQLGWATLTRLFGKADMVIWGLVFLPLLASRMLVLAGLARATQDTLLLSKPLAMGVALILLPPILYTFWSIIRYFGLTRAMVGDHFRLRYRQMPLENRGIFKYSSNAMYTFGFLVIWAIALVNFSLPALIMAAFQHIYIWVHYYCTEKPDMEIIYQDELT